MSTLIRARERGEEIKEEKGGAITSSTKHNSPAQVRTLNEVPSDPAFVISRPTSVD